MPTIKGILSFPTLFQPKPVRDAQGNPTGDAKFSATILLGPNDPQLAAIQQEVEQAKANTFPSGFPAKADVCLVPYDAKYAGKDYYDPRFTGYWVFSCTAKSDDKPAVVDMARQPIVDAGQVCSGSIVYLNAGISGYTKGTGGVGGWLNGVMATGELCEFGRLDGKPSVDQMFANVDVGDATTTPSATSAAPQAPAAPTPPGAPVPPSAPPAAPQFQMTPAANGTTREAYHAAGWSDEQLIANDLMLPPNGVQPSFA